MKKEYSIGRKIGKGVEDLHRIFHSDYDFKFPLIYIRRHKENLVIITESEYKRLKEIEKEMKRIDICLRLGTRSAVSCFSYKGKMLASMSTEKYTDLVSKKYKDKENK